MSVPSLPLVALGALLCLVQPVLAGQRKDAAEAVQEGSVANWLEYYRKERGLHSGDTKPAPPPGGASTSTQESKPGTDSRGR